ncbi:MAG: hypothetical protein WA861_09815 [Candidatus Binatus sp.]
MTSKSGAKVMKRWGQSPGRTIGVLIATILLALSLMYVVPLAAKGWPVDQAGATMISYHSLIEAPAKFDKKLVWVIGAFKIRNGTAYLSETSSGSDPQKSVCVAPTESIAASVVDPTGSGRRAILARFAGLDPISVHGRYESAPSSQCPNGTVFAALLEVSLE